MISHRHVIEAWIPSLMWTKKYTKYPTECSTCKKKLVIVLTDHFETYEVPEKDWQEVVDNHGK